MLDAIFNCTTYTFRNVHVNFVKRSGPVLASPHRKLGIHSSKQDNFESLILPQNGFREACINFMELCNKKNNDKIWMDEIAAMQASYFRAPGIIISGANTDLPQTGLEKSSTSESITRHGSLDTSEGTAKHLSILMFSHNMFIS